MKMIIEEMNESVKMNEKKKWKKRRLLEDRKNGG